jgi:hypothetical protein
MHVLSSGAQASREFYLNAAADQILTDFVPSHFSCRRIFGNVL